MLKEFYRNLLVVSLVVILVLSVMPFTAVAAVSTTVNGVGITTTGGSDTYTSTSVTAKATTTASSSCNDTTYKAETNTVVLTNSSGADGILTFTYTITFNNGTVKVNGSSVTGNGTFSANVANGESVTVVITSSANTQDTTTVVFGDFGVVANNVPRNVTVNGAAGGTVKVGGSTNLNAGQSTTVSVNYDPGLSLVATPDTANGYTFCYWTDGNGSVLSTAASYTLKPTADITVSPIFSNGGIFSVGNSLFTNLTDALSYAQSQSTKIVIPFKDCTVPAGNYTVPNGVTLLVPFNSDNTVYTNKPAVAYESYKAQSPFRTLTLADGANITVANGGKICVPSKLLGYSNANNGTPSDKYGKIAMASGSSITLQNGAGLYVYGYISGSGNVIAQSGSTVYEAMQFRCWRGGTATSGMRSGVFPMSQYYVQNIEAPLTLEAGSTEYVYTAVNAQSTAYPASAEFIGSGGMFYPTSGSVTKRYDGATDRLIIDVNGNLSVKSMSLSLSVVTLNTADYDSMPINSNITIHIHSGTTTVNQNLSFLPGTEMIVDQGANFNIASGKKVFVYDQDEWGEYAQAGKKLVPIGYSTVNGTRVIRTEASLVDSKLDINGTVNVNGSFYTTESGANIISSHGTGRIVFNSAAASNTTTQQVTQSGTSTTKVNINVTSVKLHNHDGSYTATAGSAQNDFFTYSRRQDKWIKGNETNEIILDVNEDGVEDVLDVGFVISASSDEDFSMTSSQQAKADLNGDGFIDAFDAAMLDRTFNRWGFLE